MDHHPPAPQCPPLSRPAVQIISNKFGYYIRTELHSRKCPFCYYRDLIIGIAVSAGIAAIMILACVYLFWRRSKNKVKITKDEALQQHSRLVSPFTSLPSAQSTSLSAAESQSPSQPLMHPPGLSKQRSKFDLNALHQGQTPTTSHRRAETSTSGSESVIQVIQQAEAPESRIPADTSISPPQYTLSPDNPRNIDHART